MLYNEKKMKNNEQVESLFRAIRRTLIIKMNESWRYVISQIACTQLTILLKIRRSAQ